LNLIEVILAQGSMVHTPRSRARPGPPTCHRIESTMAHITDIKRLSIIAAAWLAMSHASAQTSGQTSVTAASPPASAASAASTQLAPVTVTARAPAVASVAGWGEIPLAKTPLQASVFSAEQLRDSGSSRLAGITALDPAVSDAYNSEGYYDFLTVRGFVLNNDYNFRRDGLPINAESLIPLDNKSRVEILKGTSGMQAGTSAPGGLVNFVVKRPLDAPLSEAFVEWRQPGSVTGSVDLSRRFGETQAFGVRVNVAGEHIDPWIRSARGERHLFALAADWRLTPDTLLEAEIESSRHSQPSQPGFSMLGNVVPAPGDPRINLNNQPWSLPVVFNATTASLRWQQKLANDWHLTTHLATQRLRSDDRLAYPFGCSKEGNYDRYCSDGSFDFYDFRSDNERRDTDTFQFAVDGKAETFGLPHTLGFGVLESRFKTRTQPQIDDGTIVGSGTVDGATVTMLPTNPPLGLVSNTNRTERSTEFFAHDAIALTERITTWLGLRHTSIHRESSNTDGSIAAQSYTQSFTTPWAAASYALSPGQLVYASWGQGVESSIAPNQAIYTNASQPLPSLKSRQTEVGLKGASDHFDWGIAVFDISQPTTGSVGSCDDPGTCRLVTDGTERHRGVELTGAWHQGPWSLNAGSQWLHARREGSQTAAINGLQPTNVPAVTLKLQAAYDLPWLPGLNLQSNLMHESSRKVLPDNSTSIPGYTRVDAGLRYVMTKIDGSRWTWRAGIDNLFDKRAWRESPFEFSHVYLYPLQQRTLRLSLQVDV
jgi:iron complex outermembrane receptor protein